MKIRWQDYLLHGIYLSIYGLVKYFPPPIGDWLRLLVTRPFLSKCDKVRIQEGVTFGYPYRIQIGHDVTLNEWVFLSGFGGVRIGNYVRIGHRTSILSSDHRHEDLSRPIHEQGLDSGEVIIEDGVYIGCNVTILKGVTIGQGAVVGAGSVVTRSVPAFSIVAGVPARQIAGRGVRSQET